MEVDDDDDVDKIGDVTICFWKFGRDATRTVLSFNVQRSTLRLGLLFGLDFASSNLKLWLDFASPKCEWERPFSANTMLSQRRCPGWYVYSFAGLFFLLIN